MIIQTNSIDIYSDCEECSRTLREIEEEKLEKIRRRNEIKYRLLEHSTIIFICGVLSTSTIGAVYKYYKTAREYQRIIRVQQNNAQTTRTNTTSQY